HHAGFSVRRLGSPPSMGTRHKAAPAGSHDEPKTTHLPSLVTLGWELSPQLVSCLGLFPSMLIRQICTDPVRSESKTMYRPSPVTTGTESIDPGGVSCLALVPSPSIIQIAHFFPIDEA